MSRYMSRREMIVSPRNFAMNGVPYALSFILDIMDQSKCHVPSLGSLGEFKDPFNQMIIGVKVNV